MKKFASCTSYQDMAKTQSFEDMLDSIGAIVASFHKNTDLPSQLSQLVPLLKNFRTVIRLFGKFSNGKKIKNLFNNKWIHLQLEQVMFLTKDAVNKLSPFDIKKIIKEITEEEFYIIEDLFRLEKFIKIILTFLAEIANSTGDSSFHFNFSSFEHYMESLRQLYRQPTDPNDDENVSIEDDSVGTIYPRNYHLTRRY